jgi:threonylcarbamoyladenosine tRNA methylthiotransferase CDKAL1
VKMEGLKKVFIDTSGCEEARLDTQKLKNLVQGTSYVCTNDARLADIIVFYACGHLQINENESINAIRRLISLKKSSAMLVVWGCLSEINREAVRRVHKGPLIGPENWDFFYDLFDQPKQRMHYVHANRLSVKSRLIRSPLVSVKGLLNLLRETFFYESPRKTWFIKIESGCKEKCTYCSDRLAFKCVRSQPMDVIISQFELGLESGFKRFQLVGRDLGSYGCDIDSDLPALLNKILENHSDQDYKLYLRNMSPMSLIELYPRLNNIFSSGKIFQIGSHIQSGSDRVLGLMGRKFSVLKWLSIMKEINKNYPDIRLYTSIIVGFPTETEQDFNKSMELLDNLLFDTVDLYKYEERPNIPSLRLRGRVPSEVIEARTNRMGRKIISNYFKKRIRGIQVLSLIQALIFAIDFSIARASYRFHQSEMAKRAPDKCEFAREVASAKAINR